MTSGGHAVFRSVAYWVALAVTALFVLVATAAVVDVWAARGSWGELREPSPWSELVALVTLLLTSITTFTAVFFGWRLDRRQARELELKVKELELRLGPTPEAADGTARSAPTKKQKRRPAWSVKN